jgi:flagellar biosynthesis protein FliR
MSEYVVFDSHVSVNITSQFLPVLHILNLFHLSQLHCILLFLEDSLKMIIGFIPSLTSSINIR